MKDPIALINVLCTQSYFVCIGGDHGGGTTKLGITFELPDLSSSFLPLVITDGKDSYDDLAPLAKPGVLEFDGQSSDYRDIFSIFQHLVHTHPRVFINGDWAFINGITGLKSAAAKHPCSICTSHTADFLNPAAALRYRPPERGHDRVRTPLIVAQPQWIVPLPLHVVLGILNRIIDKPLTTIFGEKQVSTIVGTVKQIHAPGSGGRADFHALNGGELTRWIKTDCVEKLIEASRPGIHELTVARARLLNAWMKQLHADLLNKDEITRTRFASLCALVDDIHRRWVQVTGDNAFPKLHMLHHVKSFAAQHLFLGRFSESSIESSHCRMNFLIHVSNRNLGSDWKERYRRSLARVIERLVQPFLSTS